MLWYWQSPLKIPKETFMIEHNEIQLVLSGELKKLENLQRKLKNSLHTAPIGTLHILQKNGKSPQYYLYEGREKRKYISKKNIEFARGLAQKEYEQKLLNQVEERIQCIQNMIKTYQVPLVSIYQEMPETKKTLITPYELSDKEFVKQWYSDHPGCMNIYPISTNYYSNQGIQVRSKSEKIIADMFEKYKVPYVYEPSIHLKSGSIVYPDFLVLNRRLRKQFIYEHFGIMSDPQYSDRTIEKISIYQQNGYFPGDNFLFSMESQNKPLDTRCIEKMIENYLK